MKDTDDMVERIMKIVEAKGIAFVNSCEVNRFIPKKNENYEVYSNRRLRRSVVVEPKKLKKILDLL